MKRGDLRILLIHLALAILGWCLLPHLGLAPPQAKTGPRLRVQALLPGATPRQVEGQLTTPLEAAAASLPGVDKLYSVSSHGQSTLRIDLEPRVPLAFIEQDLRRRLRRVHAQWPAGTPFPTVSGGTGAAQPRQPLLTYYLLADASLALAADSLRRAIAAAFAMMPELGGVQIEGEPSRQLMITYREAALQAHGVAPATLDTWLRQWGATRGLGRWTQQGHTRLLSLAPTVPTLADLRQAPFPLRPGQTVALRELVHMEVVSVPPRRRLRFDGRPALRVTFLAAAQAAPWRLSQRIERQMPSLRRRLPVGYRLVLAQDHSQPLRQAMTRALGRAGLAAALVLALAAALTRSGAYVRILLICLLASLGLSWVGMYVLGLGFDQYTLAALSIGFGLMADQVIMAADTYRRWGRLAPMAVPLAAATLTTLAALAVIGWLPVSLRLRLLPFGLTLATILLASLWGAIALVPPLWRWMGPGQTLGLLPRAPVASGWAAAYTWLLPRRGWVWALCVLLVGLPVYGLPPQLPLTHPLSAPYNATLGSRFFQEEIRPWTDRLLGGTSRLFYLRSRLSAPGEAPPRGPQLTISATLPPNFSPEATDALMQRFEQLCRPYAPYLSRYVTDIRADQRARLRVWFRSEATSLGIPYRLQTQASRLALAHGEVRWQIQGEGQGFQHAPPRYVAYSLLLRGYQFDELARMARLVGDSLRRNDRVDSLDLRAELRPAGRVRSLYRLRLDPVQAQQQGLLWPDWAASWAALNTRLTPGFTLPLRGAGARRRYPVVLRSDLADTLQLDHLTRARWLSPAGQLVLGQGMQAERYVPESAIHKENQQYLRRIDFIYRGAGTFARRHLDHVLAVMRDRLPPGYTLEKHTDRWVGGQEADVSLLTMWLAVGGLIFVICACLFESLRRAFWVLALLPVSFVGAFVAYAWAAAYVAAGTLAALLLLGGLTVNNTIFLVHHLHQAPDRRLGTLLAWTRDKVLPLVLTTLTTVVAMLPILGEAQPQPFWYHLALGSVGGLLGSTPLLLLLLPLLMAERLPRSRASQ